MKLFLNNLHFSKSGGSLTGEDEEGSDIRIELVLNPGLNSRYGIEAKRGEDIVIKSDIDDKDGTLEIRAQHFLVGELASGPQACIYCGMHHDDNCPRVKHIEHYDNGTLRSVEFHAHQDLPKDMRERFEGTVLKRYRGYYVDKTKEGES